MRVLFLSQFTSQEPLGIMTLSTALKAAGHEARLIFVPDTNFEAKVREYAPGVVCYSMTTGWHTPIGSLNLRVKQILPNVVSICGGMHVTLVPEFLQEPGIDAICRGEGERALVDFVNAVEQGDDLRHIPNIHWKDADGKIWANEPRPLEPELESFGQLDRDIVYDAAEFYRTSERKVIKTDRGCPMNCSFCFHHAWKKKIYKVSNNEYVRRRGVDHVIAEAKMLKQRYPLTFVHFVDDIFNVNNKWLEDFAEKWPRDVGVPFDCILMANMVTEKHIALLKQAGCIQVRIAFEAANDHMRNAIMKKNTTRAQLVRASAHIKAAGLRLASLNMLGGPGGSIEDDFETIKLNIECKVDHPLASLLQPYPMTDINDITSEMGFAMDEWSEFPTLYNRTSSIALANRHHYENLHKWFPMIVRHPWLLPVARRAIKLKFMHRPYLFVYMLYSEWLVTEQNAMYYRIQGKKSFKTLSVVDFTSRVITRGFLRLFSMIFGQSNAQLSTKMQLNDERVMNHIE